MSISEFEIARCKRELEKFLARKRPPVHVRDRLDFGCKFLNQSVELFEIRPTLNESEIAITIPFAKATFVNAKKVWRIYWQRQDLKWHSYEPVPQVKHFEEFLEVVLEDACFCFFG